MQQQPRTLAPNTTRPRASAKKKDPTERGSANPGSARSSRPSASKGRSQAPADKGGPKSSGSRAPVSRATSRPRAEFTSSSPTTEIREARVPRSPVSRVGTRSGAKSKNAPPASESRAPRGPSPTRGTDEGTGRGYHPKGTDGATPPAKPSRTPRSLEKPSESRSQEASKGGPFDDIAWGRRTVTEYLRAGRPMNRLYILTSAEGLNKEFFHLAKEHNVPVVRCERARLDTLTGGGNHQGVVAQMSSRAYTPWDQILLDFQDKNGLCLALSGVQDPGNLGAILRTAEAAGCRQVVLSAEQSCGLNATVSKVSAGADGWLDVARVGNLKKALMEFKEQGIQVVVTVPKSELALYDVNLKRPTVLVLGSEGAGLDRAIIQASTHQVALPMLGKVESLNVAAAAAVVLYEVVRQRRER